MLQSFVSFVTTMAMLVHATIGCCAHHGHADANVDAHCEQHGHAAETNHDHGCRHDADVTDDVDEHVGTPVNCCNHNPIGHDDCSEENCQFVQTTHVKIQRSPFSSDLDSSVIMADVNQQGRILSAGYGQPHGMLLEIARSANRSSAARLQVWLL